MIPKAQMLAVLLLAGCGPTKASWDSGRPIDPTTPTRKVTAARTDDNLVPQVEEIGTSCGIGDRRMNLSADREPVVALLEAVAAAAGVEIKIDDSIEGAVTVELREEPILGAIIQIAEAAELDARLVDCVVVVTP